MKTVLFLGAGASAFASQPTTKDLLALLRDRVHKRKNNPNRNAVLQAYAEHIVGAKAYYDVEALYDGLQTMIGTHDNSNCKPITEKILYHDHDGHTVTYEEVVDELKGLKSTIRETLLSSFKVKPNIRKSIGETYDTIRSVIKENGADEFQVVTTNYDLVMEEYAKERGFEIVNGFGPPEDLRRVWKGAWGRNTDKPPLYLSKIHGSINWYKDDGVIMETWSPARRDAEGDVMIAPTEGAKRYDCEPFATLMRRFRDVLQDADVLLVIGFSYRDDEIVRIIKERLAEGMVLISVSPDVRDVRPVADAGVDITHINVSLNLGIIDQSSIVLCMQWFKPDTVNDVRAALEEAYEFARHVDNDVVPRPQTPRLADAGEQI